MNETNPKKNNCCSLCSDPTGVVRLLATADEQKRADLCGHLLQTHDTCARSLCTICSRFSLSLGKTTRFYSIHEITFHRDPSEYHCPRCLEAITPHVPSSLGELSLVDAGCSHSVFIHNKCWPTCNVCHQRRPRYPVSLGFSTKWY